MKPEAHIATHIVKGYHPAVICYRFGLTPYQLMQHVCALANVECPAVVGESVGSTYWLQGRSLGI